MSFMKKFLFWFLLMVFASIVYLFLDFAVTKTVILNKQIPNNKNKDIKQKKFWRVKHDIYHHGFMPDINVIDENGKFGNFKFITNSIGFRDSSSRKIKYENDGQRIIFIGDSFTEGLLVNFEDSFVGIIQKNFEKKNIDILNAGVSSYSPSIYYTKIKFFIDKGLKFNQLVVYVDISDIEDEALNYRIINNKVVSLLDLEKKEPKRNIEKNIINFLKKNFYISYFILNFFHDEFTLTLNKEFTEEEYDQFVLSDKYPRDKWTLNKRIRSEYNIGIINSIKYMKLLSDLCKKNNIKMTIAVYPWPSQIYYNDLHSQQVEIWKNFSDTNKIQFINHFPIFFDNNIMQDDLKQQIKKYYISFDIHFNKNGNKLIAKDFLNKFKIDY